MRNANAGFTVESVRITTQPFPDYVKGLPREEAVRFLLALDALSTKQDFQLCGGPAMMRDGDDAGATEIVAEVLTKASGNFASNTHIAGTDGIHWNAVKDWNWRHFSLQPSDDP